MNLNSIVLKTKNGNYNALYHEGTKYNDVAFLYYHGLNGRAKVVKPLLNKINEFDFYSIEQRGHANSLQKASTSPKKHDNDIRNVVKHLRQKYNKIYLCGESMGALFISRYAYKWDDVDAVFAWSIPFYPKDIMKEKKSKKFVIIFRVLLCLLTGINYKYSAKVDFPKLTNSKFLLKLNELDFETKNSTCEEVAIWKSHFFVKKMFLRRKPKVPVFYWVGTEDIMSSKKLVEKIKQKNNVSVGVIEGAKHILMYESGASEIFNKMVDVAKNGL